MQILVTGGAGFIGSHLVHRLVRLGHRVVILDDLSTGTITRIQALIDSRHARLVAGDVCDLATVEAAAGGCERIYHLAAGVGVRNVLEQPLRTLITNLRGTENVFEVAARRAVPVLYTSSSEVYGSSESSEPVRESADRSYGSTAVFRWSYAGAKAAGEMLAFAYHEDLALPVVVVRLFNVAGPGQSPHYGMVLPRFVRQALRGQPITVFGDGTQRRCFAHVEDAVGALVALLEEPSARGNLYNVGGDREVTMNDLAQLVRCAAGSASEIVHVPYEDVYPRGFAEIRRRAPDLSRIRSAIGYQPSHTLEEIVADAVADAVRDTCEGDEKSGTELLAGLCEQGNRRWVAAHGAAYR